MLSFAYFVSLLGLTPVCLFWWNLVTFKFIQKTLFQLKKIEFCQTEDTSTNQEC